MRSGLVKRQDMRLSFGDRGKKQLVDGSHRTTSVVETLNRLRPLLLAFGITRLANITGLDRVGLPVVIAVRPNARSIAVSQGKGSTISHAEASAAMESVEIWHAERLDNPVYFACPADLAERHRIVDIDRLLRTPGTGPSQSERLLWVNAVELYSDQDVLVPFEMVHADYTRPLPPGSGFFPSSTNGLASGNHILEAVCHGLCEVIERDALSVWHHAPTEFQQASRLDLQTVDDATALNAMAMFADAGLECAVWDVTSDVGVASFLCVVRDSSSPEDHLGLGSGTHPDRALALQRALNEAAQTRLNYISGAREDLSVEEYNSSGRMQKTDAFLELLGTEAPTRRLDQVPMQLNDDLQADLDWLLQRLQLVGIEQVAVVDLTRAEFGIPVVRVIVPGLEAPHDDDSYVPGPRALRAAREGLSA